MAESISVKVKRDGTLSLAGSTGGPYVVAYELGDVKFNGNPKDSQVPIMDRGNFAGLRKGDQQLITGSFTVHFRQFASSSAAVQNLIAIIDGDTTAGADGWTVADAAYEQWNLDITFSIAAVNTDDAATTATFSTCVLEWEFSEGDPDSCSVSFNCYGGVVFTGPS